MRQFSTFRIPAYSLKIIFLFFGLFNISSAFGQVVNISIGTESKGISDEVKIKLVKRLQSLSSVALKSGDIFDNSIHSPKSVQILNSKNKFYVNSLEGGTTSVYTLDSIQKIKTIRHQFSNSNHRLFHDSTYFDYKFPEEMNEPDVFTGKPVEGCFSHNGRYLWITYYRRSWDANACWPSALCIVDTKTDEIIRVMPTAPLPKMIACAPDNKTIAVTHWGDNTVGLIDISADNPDSFRYVANTAIDYRMKLDFSEQGKINRDQNCGNCLRGTVFTPDGKTLLVGKMGGASIGVIDINTNKFSGSINGTMSNMRHLLIRDEWLYLSIHKSGYVQRANLNDLLRYYAAHPNVAYNHWESVFVGCGVRTIVVDPSGKYIFAAINQGSKIAVVRTSDMKVITTCEADSYPVGMDISGDGKRLIVTAQGKSGKGGNSVMIFDVTYNNAK